jgi:endonuclease YncB( thermonuclease family)
MAARMSISRSCARGKCSRYRHYAHEQSPADRVLYKDAENRAREKRLGLWRDPNPVPPWEWRRR